MTTEELRCKIRDYAQRNATYSLLERLYVANLRYYLCVYIYCLYYDAETTEEVIKKLTVDQEEPSTEHYKRTYIWTENYAGPPITLDVILLVMSKIGYDEPKIHTYDDGILIAPDDFEEVDSFTWVQGGLEIQDIDAILSIASIFSKKR